MCNPPCFVCSLPYLEFGLAIFGQKYPPRGDPGEEALPDALLMPSIGICSRYDSIIRQTAEAAEHDKKYVKVCS